MLERQMLEFYRVPPDMPKGSDERRVGVDPDVRLIAIVDDDPAVCDSTRVLLEVHDFEVSTYLSSTDFLNDSPKIGCLIVDYHMPGLNGLELVTELRARGSEAPVIMITATTDPSVERRAVEQGIKRVLQKPLASQVLLQALRDALR